MPPKNAKTESAAASESTVATLPATNEPATTPATPAPGDAKKKREMKAEHDWIDAAGDVTEELEKATGIKYRDRSVDETSLDASFTYQVPGAVAGTVLTMAAVWGLRTKATNTASQARQKRAKDDTFTTLDVPFMRSVFAEIKDGQWEAPSAGAKPKGPKYDNDVLADVIVAALVAEGATPDRVKIRAKLGDEPAYGRGAMQMDAIRKEYERIKGVVAKPISSLMV